MAALVERYPGTQQAVVVPASAAFNISTANSS
jgi:hypothetical protein